jgi:hypothetical protein
MCKCGGILEIHTCLKWRGNKHGKLELYGYEKRTPQNSDSTY